MSTLKTTNLQNADASSANIVLGQGSGGGATISGVTTSSTLRATTGIVTTATITTSRTTTGITTTATIDTATVGGVTTLNSDGISCTGISTAKVFVPTEGQLSNRNLIINGAMNVAQRGTSSGTEGYSTIDRFSNEEGSCDEAPTQSQHDLTSSDTGPWAEGFRHSFHIQNGNQTSGAQAANFIKLSYLVEAQDMAQSGWNYTSTSSYITLSFWVKSSVAQNFYGRLTTQDGSQYNYPFETGSLSANTWTKITKTIPGNANLTINNDNGAGLLVEWMTYRGGNTTASGVALDTWAAYASGTRTPDQTSTWFTTNDATFEVTGVQLEVGSAATPFEHRSYADELTRCQRYFWQVIQDGSGTAAFVGSTIAYGSSYNIMTVANPVEMRDKCSALTTSGTAADYQLWGNSTVVDLASVPTLRATSSKLQTSVDVPYNVTAGDSRVFRIKASTVAYLGFSAEF